MKESSRIEIIEQKDNELHAFLTVTKELALEQAQKVDEKIKNGENMITLDLELRDVPGELIRALTPISNMGVNIFSVIHLREKKTDGRVPVRVVINDVDSKLLNDVINKLEEMDIIITKVNETIRKTDIDIVVVGHVVDTDVRDTIDRLNKYGIVVDLDLSMPDPFKESSARMKVIIETDKLDDLCKELDKISEEKNLLFIKSF